jgi:RNA polymerase sigma-70 factor (ECF subfamily)
MLAGDGGAFGRFFDAAYPALSPSRALGGNRDARPASQAAICQAIRKLATYRGEAALLAWLYTFARHEVRRPPRWRRLPVDLSEDDPRSPPRSVAAHPPAAIWTRNSIAKVAAFVQRVLDHLPTSIRTRWSGDSTSCRCRRSACSSASASRPPVLLTRARLAFREAFQTMSPLRADGTGYERPWIERAVEATGRRAVPDEHHQARARAAAQAEWKRLARRRRWSRALWAPPSLRRS